MKDREAVLKEIMDWLDSPFLLTHGQTKYVELGQGKILTVQTRIDSEAELDEVAKRVLDLERREKGK